jgi:hypothetical protein
MQHTRDACLVPHPQTEALRCLLTYKHGYLNVHKETLEALLDEDKFRDALAKFDIAEDGGQIAREHRPELLNVWLETHIFEIDSDEKPQGCSMYGKKPT